MQLGCSHEIEFPLDGRHHRAIEQIACFHMMAPVKQSGIAEKAEKVLRKRGAPVMVVVNWQSRSSAA